MWFAESRVRVWLYRRPTDMRRSFDGLSAMVKRELGEEPTSGALYVFVNRRKTLMKVLYFERSGYCVWSKRLEQGQFQVRWGGSTPVRCADRSSSIVMGIVRLTGSDLKNLQSKALRLQVGTTRPGRRLELV